MADSELETASEVQKMKIHLSSNYVSEEVRVEKFGQVFENVKAVSRWSTIHSNQGVHVIKAMIRSEPKYFLYQLVRHVQPVRKLRLVY